METFNRSFAIALSYGQRLMRNLITTVKAFIWMVYFPLFF